MGAIDPRISPSCSPSKSKNKFKSASLEASLKPSDCSTNLFGYYEISTLKPLNQLDELQLENSNDDHTGTKVNNNNSKLKHTNSFHLKARKFFNLSPTPLRPSSSTSCLFSATSSDESNDPSSSLASMPTRASLTHEWKKLKTPNKCRECNLLVYFNGRECAFCGFVAHKKCATNLVIKCCGQKITDYDKGKTEPSDKETQSSNHNRQHHNTSSRRKSNLKSNQPIYGQPILIDSYEVVDFIRRFIYEIDSRGLTSKGIYRVSSIKSKVDRLCNYYDQNSSSLVDLSSFHPNIIANAFKMYLRQLPEPLLTNHLYTKFIELAKKYPNDLVIQSANNMNLKTTDTRIGPIQSELMVIVELKEIIDQLPPINRQLVAIIMRHLKRVADMSETNQMSSKNLSIIFGPTLLSASDKSTAIVDSIHQARVVELMITWAGQIFPTYTNYESKAVIDLNTTTPNFQEATKCPRSQIKPLSLGNPESLHSISIEVPKVDITLYEDDEKR